VTLTTINRLQASVSEGLAMLAGMRLEIFTHLADGPRDAAALAAVMGVAPDRLSRLLHALVVCGLLERSEAGFANTAEAAAFLVKGKPGYVGGVHALLDQLWHADLKTAESVLSGKPAAPHDFLDVSDAEMAGMLRGMHDGAVGAGRVFPTVFDFSGCRSVIDIGGGSGGFVAALCEACPHIAGRLFDLPRTVRLAGDILARTPGGDRVTTESGDILAAAPSGLHDAAILRAVVQVLGPDDAARAIAHAAQAVRPGGTLYIAGAGILDDDRLGPRRAVFFNLTFMNLYRSGAAYTVAEHAAWLAAARCGDVRRTALPDGSAVIVARKLG
jgi:O-methyltransferase domain/Dimerisation domain